MSESICDSCKKKKGGGTALCICWKKRHVCKPYVCISIIYKIYFIFENTPNMIIFNPHKWSISIINPIFRWGSVRPSVLHNSVALSNFLMPLWHQHFPHSQHLATTVSFNFSRMRRWNNTVCSLLRDFLHLSEYIWNPTLVWLVPEVCCICFWVVHHMGGPWEFCPFTGWRTFWLFLAHAHYE